MMDNNSRLRLSRVVFGTTWTNPDLLSSSGMFSVPDLQKRFLESYGVELDADLARNYLDSMVTTGYMVKQEDMYGVIMTPLNA